MFAVFSASFDEKGRFLSLRKNVEIFFANYGVLDLERLRIISS